MTWKAIAIASLALALASGDALAQRGGQRGSSRSRSSAQHTAEITPFGGYVWTFSREAFYGTTGGKVDISDSGFWGVAVDINVRPGGFLHLLYQRQDADLTFSTYGGINIAPQAARTPIGVEYWQIGGVGGMPQGNILPFTSLSLGATRYILKDFNQDEWKFSIILGLGAKVYANDRLGLRVQARMPWTIFSGGAGIGCGGGGCYTTFGGTGIAQIDVSAGLMILL